MKLFSVVRLALALAGSLTVAMASPIVFNLGADPAHDYLGEDVGPYLGTLTRTAATNFFCLDQGLDSTFNTRYSGTLAAPNTWQEKEAAFLGAVALHLNMVHGTHEADGPISFAIWEVMGTASHTDPAADPYLQMANFAYQHDLITPAFLARVLIFTPSDPTIQRFITAIPGCEDVPVVMQAMQDSLTEAPEPSTFLFGGTALGIVMTVARRKRAQLKV